MTTLTYTSGDLTLITDTYGRSIQLDYNSNHHLTTVIDPLGDGYDLHLRLGRQSPAMSITDPNGKTTSYTYNTLNQITSKTDRDGRLFTMLTRTTCPTQKSTPAAARYTRSPITSNWATDPIQLNQNFMRVYIPSTTSRIDGRGNIWKYRYDSNGYPLDRDCAGWRHHQIHIRSGHAEIASKTDANGHTTTYTYDSEGNLFTSLTRSATSRPTPTILRSTRCSA